MLSLAALTLVLLAPWPAAATAPPQPAAAPRVEMDTAMPAVSGAVHKVAAGGDFQKALKAAAPGDTIVLEAGASYVGSFELPIKPGAGWTVVTGSAQDRLPRPGTRVSPDDAALMPKLVARNGPAITTAPGAHHFRFVGVEIRPDRGPMVHNLVLLGRSEDTALEELPHHLVFDRCVIRGDPDRPTRRGIAMNSAWTAVVDSHLAEFKEAGADSQAIASWNGSGPFAIVRNRLEAAGENVMFGGADPTIRGLVPSDIVIRGNHIVKPAAWQKDGRGWSVKNLLELKNARRVLIDGNVLEHNWPQAQNGFAVLFTVRNQDGKSPWSVVEDVRFVNNVLRRVAAGVNVLGRDNLRPSGATARLLIANNLFYEVGTAPWGGNGALFQFLDGATDVVVERNTFLQAGPIIVADGYFHRGFVFRDNVVLDNGSGITGSGSAPGIPALHGYFPGAVFAGNVIVGGSSVDYPRGNHHPGSMARAGFVDPDRGNFRLQEPGRYKPRPGGPAPGADFDALAAALKGILPPDAGQLFGAGQDARKP